MQPVSFINFFFILQLSIEGKFQIFVYLIFKLPYLQKQYYKISTILQL